MTRRKNHNFTFTFNIMVSYRRGRNHVQAAGFGQTTTVNLGLNEGKRITFRLERCGIISTLMKHAFCCHGGDVVIVTVRQNLSAENRSLINRLFVLNRRAKAPAGRRGSVFEQLNVV